MGEENTGWITIHRKVMKNWIFQDAEKFKAWITILLEVNHSDHKVNLGNKIIICKRGESVKSLDTWARLFGPSWNKSKVRRFLKLLKSDTMIDTVSVTTSTHVKVLNYCRYQDEGKKTTRRTTREVKHTRNARETHVTPNNNGNNVNNEKEEGQNFLKTKEELVKYRHLIQHKNYAEKFIEEEEEKFFIYWTEKTKPDKQRWQCEQYFDLENKFTAWMIRAAEYNPDRARKEPFKYTIDRTKKDSTS